MHQSRLCFISEINNSCAYYILEVVKHTMWKYCEKRLSESIVIFVAISNISISILDEFVNFVGFVFCNSKSLPCVNWRRLQ